MKQAKLKVEPRTGTGRGPARRFRAQQHIPAVVYGKTKGVHTSRPITVEAAAFRNLMRSVSGSAALVQLEGLGSVVLSLVQEVKRHPITDAVMHVDFHEVCADSPMHATLPVHLKGEPEGVRNQGAMLECLAHQVHVECLPAYLPESIELDVTSLRTDEKIHIKDLAAIPHVRFLDAPDKVVVACVAPRLAQETEAAPAEAPAAPVATKAAPAAKGAAKAPAKAEPAKGAAKAPAKPAGKK
jgi:large subunit ribosomal protein L25